MREALKLLLMEMFNVKLTNSLTDAIKLLIYDGAKIL